MAKKPGTSRQPAAHKATLSMVREPCGAAPEVLACGAPEAFQAGAEPMAPAAAALRVFHRAARDLALPTEDRLRLLNLGRTKLFEALKEVEPKLDVDQTDRLGYFLAIYELSGRLVGSSGAWLKAPNNAPPFGGKTPLERMLGGRMADLIDTLTYLQGVYGGWA
jgi:hypothetical protein